MERPLDLHDLVWMLPWEAATDPAPIEAELGRELVRGHVLFGRRAVCIGRRIDQDDVLFFLPDGPQPYAVVHLTWHGVKERDTRWPSTRLFPSLAAWIGERMQPDHDDYPDDADDT